MRKALIITLGTFILMGFQQCGPKQEKVTNQELLKSVVDSIALPVHRQFQEHTRQLKNLVNRQSGFDLEKIRKQWQECVRLYSGCAYFNFGEVQYSNLHSEINKRPVDTNSIKDILASDEKISPALLQQKGANLKGLGAVEYLIFKKNEILSSEGQYLAALTEKLDAASMKLLKLWEGEEKNYAAQIKKATGNGPEGGIPLLINQMAMLLEQMNHQISNALPEVEGASPNPEILAGYGGRFSKELMMARLNYLNQLFFGIEPGLGTYLESRDLAYLDQPLHSLVRNEMNNLKENLGQIDGSLANAVSAQPDLMKKITESLDKLIIYIKLEMTSKLGITVTFSDNDGD